jgi:hypothetical protein
MRGQERVRPNEAFAASSRQCFLFIMRANEEFSRLNSELHIFIFLNLRFVGDDWSCAPENHLPESNVKLFRRIPEGWQLFPFFFLQS